LPICDALELVTLQFLDAKSHVAKALALLAVGCGSTVLYREAHHRELRKYRMQLKAADLLILDDLFMRKLSPKAGGGVGRCARESLRERGHDADLQSPGSLAPVR
jgi:hypothetical protein